MKTIVDGTTKLVGASFAKLEAQRAQLNTSYW